MTDIQAEKSGQADFSPNGLPPLEPESPIGVEFLNSNHKGT